MRTYDYLIPLAINNSSTIEINILWYFILYFCKIAMEHCYVIGKFQVNHHNSPAISHWTDVILGLQKKSASLVPIFRKLLVA
jgi:membrane glycosyltransferase